MFLLILILLPLLSAIIAPLLKPKAATYLTSLFFLLPFFGIIYSVLTNYTPVIHLMTFSAPIGEIYLNFDFIAHALGLTICIVSAMIAMFALPYMQHRFEEMELDVEKEFRTYIFLYDLYAASMLWLVYSGNLILLYVFLEIALITAFLLIYFYGYGNRQWVGQLYLIWSLVAGVLTLAGILIIGVNHDTLALNALMLPGVTVSTVAWAFIFIGMVIELPVLGPHVWLPWAHAEAPTPLSALLSPLTVGLAGYVLLRVALIDYSFIVTYRMPILAYALFSSIYAGFSVFRQTDFKRLLAYSTVSQMGYVLVALCLGPFGLIGLVIQYMSHAFGKSILFSSAGGVIAVHHGLRDLRKMGGLHDSIPTISNAAVMGFLNLGGMLTIGMLGEFFILRGVVETFGISTKALPVLLAVIFMFILSVWYGFYTIKRVFYGKPKSTERLEISSYLYVPLYIIGIVSILLLFPPLSSALIPGLKAVILGGLIP
ncbi:MAG TPA: complex I subunit 5 family protein [Desulfobacteria bacterium]|nr:complex I subunit 5 family protein [Desulfobacteria bacterium]